MEVVIEKMKILPCPFCNSDNVKVMDFVDKFAVECDLCKATGPACDFIWGAIVFWNHVLRHDEEASWLGY